MALACPLILDLQDCSNHQSSVKHMHTIPQMFSGRRFKVVDERPNKEVNTVI